jgi:hypothetical protein
MKGRNQQRRATPCAVDSALSGLGYRRRAGLRARLPLRRTAVRLYGAFRRTRFKISFRRKQFKIQNSEFLINSVSLWFTNKKNTHS